MTRTFRITCHENGDQWLRAPAKGGALQAFRDAVGATYPIVGRLVKDQRFAGRPTRVWTAVARRTKTGPDYNFTVEVQSDCRLDPNEV